MNEVLDYISPVYRENGWPLRLHIVGDVDSPNPAELLWPNEASHVLQSLLRDPLDSRKELLDPNHQPLGKPFGVLRPPYGVTADLTSNEVRALQYVATGKRFDEVATDSRKASTIRRDFDSASEALGARHGPDAVARALALGLLELPVEERNINLSRLTLHVLMLSALGLAVAEMQPYTGLARGQVDRRLAAARIALCGEKQASTAYAVGQIAAAGFIVVGRPYKRDLKTEVLHLPAIQPGSIEDKLGAVGKATIIGAYMEGNSPKEIVRDCGLDMSHSEVTRLLRRWGYRSRERQSSFDYLLT